MRLLLCSLLAFAAVGCGQAPSASDADSVSMMEAANGGYPMGPNPEVTPGALCRNSTSHRYPEHIAYCERDVSSSLKRQVIANYDRRFGFDIEGMNRGDFKIDHFIPLCIGGANSPDNLWPQHKSIYVKTDRIEEMLGRLMSMGRMSQDEAIRTIRTVKLDLSLSERIESDLNSRLAN